MRLKALALAAIPAAFLGVMSAAPTASAWSPGNCPQGSFCTWADYWYEETDQTPSLETGTEWSGSSAASIFYNNTSRDITMTYVRIADGEGAQEFTSCAAAHSGSYFTSPMYVTDVSWREDDGTPCW